MLFPAPIRRKVEVIFGGVLFLLLFAVAILGVVGDDPHIARGGVRFRSWWSDLGLLIMLVLAAPIAVHAAYVHWRRK